MNHTTNYNLSQWEADDRVQRADFNADNTKIDAAIAAADAKADALAGSKADASALAALTQTVAHKGNCQIVTGSYVGTGEHGQDHPCVLTFTHKPMFVFFLKTTSVNGVPVIRVLIRNAEWNAIGGHERENNTAIWSDRSVSWYFAGSSYWPSVAQLNEAGVTYGYIALLEA